jgi:glycosyltransferase involved in cell wall biosynthesis
MKVAIYTIALNEEKHVRRWFESTKEADYHVIADTGSSDKTVEIAKELGIQVYTISVKPWRFDDARNASLALVPADADYCIAMDMDEIMRPGWRAELEKAYAEGIDKPRYNFVTDFNPDGTPKASFLGFRIHTRQNVRWTYPIHEVPTGYYRDKEETSKEYNIESWHLPDGEKSRGNYLPMLEKAAAEDPCARNLYYLGREYFYRNKYEESTTTLKKYLEVSIFPAEKSYAYRILSKTDPANAEEHLMKATEVYQSRESILALANYYYHQKQWAECNKVAKIGLEQTVRTTEFLSEDWAWSHMAEDLIAISAWNLGKWQEAYKYGVKALEITPTDERLKTNVKFYKEKLDGNIRPTGGRGKK